MQDMMHCLSPSLLERQRTHLYWQHQQQQQQQISLENLLTEGGWPHLSTPRQYPINTREEVTTPSPTTSITTTSAPQVGKCSKKRKADKPPMVSFFFSSTTLRDKNRQIHWLTFYSFYIKF